MPFYKDTPQNRRLKRVGMGYGKECSPCKPKKEAPKKEAPKSTPKPKPAPAPVKKAPAIITGVDEGPYTTVKNPKDISSSTVIKRQLKLDLDVALQVKLEGIQLKESKKITKKFIIWVDSRKNYNNDQVQIIKNYDKLPKNMKDNVTLLFHKGGDVPEIENKLKKYNLTPFSPSGAEGIYFGFYNP